jgi:uracil-DNA glycosylase family protein
MRRVILAHESDFDGWRHAARALALDGVPPEQVAWSVGEGGGFAEPAAGGAFTVPRRLVRLAETVIRAPDPERFALLYALVWRIHGGERQLLDDAADPLMQRLQAMAGSAPRDTTAGGLAALAEEAAGCRRCPLWQKATQTVFGEGPADARLMLVGEQPGDSEDLAGRPFVGPAGQVLDRALAEAGIDRAAVYVTNAVKHFKFEPRGRRRIHATPDQGEIELCRFWLDQERALIRPALTVLLGGSAARAVLGRAVTISRERGRPIALAGGAAFVTVHPSFLLRLPDEAARAREYAAFVSDLRAAKALAAAPSP